METSLISESPYVEREGMVEVKTGKQKVLKVLKGIFVALVVILVILIIVYFTTKPKVTDATAVAMPATASSSAAVQLNCSQTAGPYPLDCLRQWWKSAGCTSPLGTSGQTKYWDGLPADSVKADMKAFATLQDQPHVNWCHVEAPL